MKLWFLAFMACALFIGCGERPPEGAAEPAPAEPEAESAPAPETQAPAEEPQADDPML